MKTLLYQQVYDDIRHQIEIGGLPAGSRIPSLEALAESYGVSTITTRRALDMLASDGLVLRRPRIGTVVMAPDSRGDEPSQKQPILVGCLVTNYDDTFGTQLLSGVLDAAEGRAEVVVKRSMGDLTREEDALRSLVDFGVHGVILEPTSSLQISSAVLELAARRFPLVIVDRSVDSVPISSVSSDNFGGGKLATEHLIGLGHRHIAWMAPPPGVSTVEDRHAGYVRAQAEHDIAYLASQELTSIKSVVPGAVDGMGDDLDKMDEFLTTHPDVTAFLVSEYNIALLLATACRRRGILVGKDVAVVCFDHPASVFDPDRFTFTHIRQDQAAMAGVAVDQLLAEVQRPGSVEHHIVPIELVMGDSSTATT